MRRANLARCGTPGRTRTCDARIRNPELYPPELRGHLGWINEKIGLVKIVENSYTNDQLFARSFSFCAQGNLADIYSFALVG